MSIYSGFSSRHTEEVYNGLLFKMLSLLQNQLIYYIDVTHQSQQLQYFNRCFLRIYKKMSKLQQNKYLPPKFTDAVQQLYLKLDSGPCQVKPRQYASKNMQLSYQNLQPHFRNPEQSLHSSRFKQHPRQYRKLYMSTCKNNNYVEVEREEIKLNIPKRKVQSTLEERYQTFGPRQFEQNKHLFNRVDAKNPLIFSHRPHPKLRVRRISTEGGYDRIINLKRDIIST